MEWNGIVVRCIVLHCIAFLFSKDVKARERHFFVASMGGIVYLNRIKHDALLYFTLVQLLLLTL
jgi:hypothetical protein